MYKFTFVFSKTSEKMACRCSHSGNSNSDQVDVFGFKKPNYDNKLMAKMPSERDDMFYNMNHKRRGIALIFNHEHFEIDKLRSRTGTSVDAGNFKRILQNLGFEVILHNDLKTRKIFEEVNKGRFTVIINYKKIFLLNYSIFFFFLQLLNLTTLTLIVFCLLYYLMEKWVYCMDETLLTNQSNCGCLSLLISVLL